MAGQAVAATLAVAMLGDQLPLEGLIEGSRNHFITSHAERHFGAAFASLLLAWPAALKRKAQACQLPPWRATHLQRVVINRNQEILEDFEFTQAPANQTQKTPETFQVLLKSFRSCAASLLRST